MVDVQFDGNDGMMTCEGCGTELPVFLDECPYCSESDDFDEEPSVDVEAPCPECGASIYDDSERCSICGAWVSMRLPSGRSGAQQSIVKVVIVLLIISLLFWMLLQR